MNFASTSADHKQVLFSVISVHSVGSFFLPIMEQRHFTPAPVTASPVWLGKGLVYWGLDRSGWTPRLPNVQLCVLAFRRFTTTIFENGKKCSTHNETTEQCNDNHGIE
jgi:hypothetical protein